MQALIPRCSTIGNELIMITNSQLCNPFSRLYIVSLHFPLCNRCSFVLPLYSFVYLLIYALFG